VVGVAVIGDVHGEAAKLEQLLSAIPNRYYVFVGDVVNRGPDSRVVLERVSALKAAGHAILLRGNHENTVLSYLAGKITFVEFALAGGIPTLRSYVSSPVGDVREAFRLAFPAEHIALLQDAIEEYRLDGAVVRHWDPAAQEALARESAGVQRNEVLIVGHATVERAVRVGDIILLDTGAGTEGGVLSAVLWPESTFVSVG
jgi:serine/threonine protein phosphatase 1